MSIVIPQLMIGGQQVPTDSFVVTGGAYGSTGSLVSGTSMAALAAAGVDVVALSIAEPGSLPVDLYITLQDGEYVHLFSGEYLTGDYDYTTDSAMLHVRDWSGPLVDQKRVLTQLLGASAAPAPDENDSGVSTQNQSLSAIVTAIANQFSLTPDLRLNDNISNSNADYGAIFGDTTDTILTASPQSLWGVLNRLAKQSGNIVYVTPEKHLVFGEAGAGVTPLSMTWRVNPPGAGVTPLERLKFTHNPRRNLTFRVLVKSYDPTLQQLTNGQAFVIGADYSPDGTSTVSAGAWGGAQASQISSSLGTKKKNAIPIYTFHADGLTASQAQSRAESIANDIAKRELILDATADLIPGMVPGQQGTVSGLVHAAFSSHTYFVTSYHHRFNIGRGEAAAGELETVFTMLDRQPEGQGKPVKKTAPVG